MELRWLVDENNVGTLQYRERSGPYTQGWTDVPVTREHKTVPFRHLPMDSTEAMLTQKEIAKQQGFTGDICVQCGGARMRRNGPCLVCEQCGQTTGCS